MLLLRLVWVASWGFSVMLRKATNQASPATETCMKLRIKALELQGEVAGSPVELPSVQNAGLPAVSAVETKWRCWNLDLYRVCTQKHAPSPADSLKAPVHRPGQSDRFFPLSRADSVQGAFPKARTAHQNKSCPHLEASQASVSVSRAYI